MQQPRDTEDFMRTTTALIATLALTLPALPAGAAAGVALSTVAAHDGYTYQWSAVGGSVVLSRPGITVVLRPGESVYQVNDHLEVANTTPRYLHGDVYVSRALAGRLDALARRSYSPSLPRSAETVAATGSTAQGSISLEARQLQGAEAIAVNGQAPANAPITLTLLAIVSSEIPTIVVSRHDVVADGSGRFHTTIPIASAYERGTILRVVATSAPGVASATAQLVTGAPNSGVSVPLENY